MNLPSFFCNNKRFLHRRVARYLLLGVITLLMLSNLFHVLSFLDRQGMHRDSVMQKQMLDARARNQTIYFNALKRQGFLTQQEIDAIVDDWDAAQYGKDK